MSAFFEGFLAGLANPKATKGVTQAGSAFYDWFKGEQQKNKMDADFNDAMRDYQAPEPQGSRSNPFGYFDKGTPAPAEGNPQQELTVPRSSRKKCCDIWNRVSRSLWTVATREITRSSISTGKSCRKGSMSIRHMTVADNPREDSFLLFSR